MTHQGRVPPELCAKQTVNDAQEPCQDMDAEARAMLVVNSALVIREGALKNCPIDAVGTRGVFRDK
jgi:hypothetical protein